MTKPTKWRTLQKWIGRIDEIHDDYFVATLYDTITSEESIAEIPIKTLNTKQKPLLELGVTFSWRISASKRSSGADKVNSVIRFRRPRPMTDKQIEQAKQRAAELRKTLNWGD